MKNWKRLSKRGLSALLALVMCVGMLPITVFAEDTEVTEPDETHAEEPATEVEYTKDEEQSFTKDPVGEGTLEDPEVTGDHLVETGSDGSVRVTDTTVTTGSSSDIVDEHHETETTDGGDDVDVVVTTTKTETRTESETTTTVTSEKEFDEENGDWSEWKPATDEEGKPIPPETDVSNLQGEQLFDDEADQKKVSKTQKVLLNKKNGSVLEFDSHLVVYNEEAERFEVLNYDEVLATHREQKEEAFQAFLTDLNGKDIEELKANYDFGEAIINEEIAVEKLEFNLSLALDPTQSGTQSAFETVQRDAYVSTSTTEDIEGAARSINGASAQYVFKKLAQGTPFVDENGNINSEYEGYLVLKDGRPVLGDDGKYLTIKYTYDTVVDGKKVTVIIEPIVQPSDSQNKNAWCIGWKKTTIQEEKSDTKTYEPEASKPVNESSNNSEELLKEMEEVKTKDGSWEDEDNKCTVTQKTEAVYEGEKFIGYKTTTETKDENGNVVKTDEQFQGLTTTDRETTTYTQTQETAITVTKTVESMEVSFFQYNQSKLSERVHEMDTVYQGDTEAGATIDQWTGTTLKIAGNMSVKNAEYMSNGDKVSDAPVFQAANITGGNLKVTHVDRGVAVTGAQLNEGRNLATYDTEVSFTLDSVAQSLLDNSLIVTVTIEGGETTTFRIPSSDGTAVQSEKTYGVLKRDGNTFTVDVKAKDGKKIELKVEAESESGSGSVEISFNFWATYYSNLNVTTFKSQTTETTTTTKERTQDAVTEAETTKTSSSTISVEYKTDRVPQDPDDPTPPPPPEIPVTPEIPEPPETPEIPDEEPPLADVPEELEDIEDEEPPLAEAPEEELEDIFDEDVPLADIPRTGDLSQAWFVMLLVSTAGLVLLLKQKESEGSVD